MVAFWQHNCKEFRYNECSEDEIWLTDAKSETGLLKIFVSMEKLLQT